MFCAMLPTSLHSLASWHGGRASLPDPRHLTALTRLHFDSTILTPYRGQLPHLPALQVLSIKGAQYLDQDNGEDFWNHGSPGPQDLGLTSSAPLLTEMRFSLGTGCMSWPHKQLATLAPLAQLSTIVLDFCYYPQNEICHHVYSHQRGPGVPEKLLRPDALLSLPCSVTKLVLRRFQNCLPAVALPENNVIVHVAK